MKINENMIENMPYKKVLLYIVVLHLVQCLTTTKGYNFVLGIVKASFISSKNDAFVVS